MREHHYDPSSGVITERVSENVEHILEDNLANRNAGNNGWSKERTFRKIGSIPMLLYNDAFRAGINPFDGSAEARAWILKTLAENPKLRTVDEIDSGKSRRGIIVK